MLFIRTAPRGWKKWEKFFGGESSHPNTNVESGPLLIRLLRTHPHHGLVLLPFDVEGQECMQPNPKYDWVC